MKDEMHEKERTDESREYPVIQKRTFVLLKILNSGKSYWFLTNNLNKQQ
jgi:hypothetical protein